MVFVYRTLNSNLILLIQRFAEIQEKGMFALNSNLILLIQAIHKIQDNLGITFKFQSDSINTHYQSLSPPLWGTL